MPLRRYALVAILPMLCLGCASATKQVATSQNTYDYREARMEETCLVPVKPAECAPAVVELDAYLKHLHEANVAVGNGGGMPLQLGALKADAKKLAQRTVAK